MVGDNRMVGPCEAVIVLPARKGVVGMTTCGAPGRERPELRPSRAVGEILCDEHAKEERARRLQG